MIRKFGLLLLVFVLSLALAIPAFAAGPNFSPQIYADGVAWGTKGLGDLPAPNANNSQSFDKLFKITNSNNPDGQLPVAEAGPGNPAYNGGRWNVQIVTWTQAGFDAHGIVPVLKSYDDVMLHYNLGHLTITSAGDYFECPLLPVK
ncbi:MAG: hypothetical protein P8Z00_03190 [Anaerolineales bacterium]|jgi:hypothetical protein